MATVHSPEELARALFDMQQELANMRTVVQAAAMVAEERAQEVDRLRAALAFYAEEANWRRRGWWRGGACHVTDDHGLRALQALLRKG
jgi:hypothetical protein